MGLPLYYGLVLVRCWGLCLSPLLECTVTSWLGSQGCNCKAWKMQDAYGIAVLHTFHILSYVIHSSILWVVIISLFYGWVNNISVRLSLLSKVTQLVGSWPVTWIQTWFQFALLWAEHHWKHKWKLPSKKILFHSSFQSILFDFYIISSLNNTNSG